jgi:hypothetical protein
VTPHDGYIALGETPEPRAAAYRRLFQFELDEEHLKEIRSAANGGFALGAEPVSTRPAQFETMVREYIARMRKLGDEIGIKPE